MPPIRRRKKRNKRPAEPKPAPGELATLQAFLNTASPELSVDPLAGPGELRRWLARRSLVDDAVELSDDDCRRALDLRAGLLALVMADGGRPPDAAALRRLEPAASRGRLEVRLDEYGPAGFGPASASFDDVLGSLLGIVAMARLEGRWPRFKLCARQGCLRSFFDHSTNGTGKWCTARCGDRVRAAAYRRTDRYKSLFKRRF